MKPKPSQSGRLHPQTSRSRGFTLIELLITISIIMVLAALVFVATRKIRAKAFQANAMSSLRQVVAANLAYSTENNGDINTLRWVGDPKEGKPWAANSFWGRLQPYLFSGATSNNQGNLKIELNRGLDSLFSSPDADTMAGTAVSGARIYHDGSGLPVPISFNANLHKWGRFLKASSFGDPSTIIYTTYGFGFFNEADGQTYQPLPKGTSSPIYYMDDKKAIAAFLDGHLEMVSPPMPSRNFE